MLGLLFFTTFLGAGAGAGAGTSSSFSSASSPIKSGVYAFLGLLLLVPTITPVNSPKMSSAGYAFFVEARFFLGATTSLPSASTAAAFFVPRLGLSSLPLSISAKCCLSVRVSVTAIVVANYFSSANYTSSYDKPIISSIIASTSIFLRVTDAL